jgi:hypothetical protein
MAGAAQWWVPSRTAIMALQIASYFFKLNQLLVTKVAHLIVLKRYRRYKN